MSKKEEKKACFVEAKSVNDIGRLACGLEKIPLPTFGIEYKNIKLMAVQADFFKEMPVVYFARVDSFNHLLAYRNAHGKEELMLTDSASNPTYTYTPIIMVKKLPKNYENGLLNCLNNLKQEYEERYSCIMVKDLVSLAKVSSYKTLYEESPLPLYIMPYQDEFVIGAFTRLEDEGSTLFFYTKLKEEPKQNFLGFSAVRASDLILTNRIDEHGRIYIKIIRLKSIHPLIDVE